MDHLGHQMIPVSNQIEFERFSRCALTCFVVRTKQSSNIDLRVHAREPLVRVTLEFERFDHVGSQAS